MSESDKRVRRPRPLWAGLLSLLFPGLGQIYAGAFRLGVILFAVGLVGHLLLVGLMLVAAPDPVALGAFLAFCLVSVLYRLGTAVAAYRLMREGFQNDPGRRWYQTTWVALIAMVAISALTTLLMAPNASEAFGWRSFNISSGSSLPTLQVRDYVMADVRGAGTLPTHGDLAVFHNAYYQGIAWVDRVVGLPGDTVQMRGGILYLNGRPVPRVAVPGRPGQYRETLPNGRSYLILEQTNNGPADNTPEFKVPPATFFVLGDNRDNSIDSRSSQYVGYVPQASLIGVLHTVYWSRDLSRFLLRLE